VSASIILHGTPPFHLYYRTQRNKEQPREEYKMFNAHRGEMSLQPDREGSYTYTFFQISDANYQHVRLHGPTIEQVVHPLAHAEFVHSSRTGRITNCEGDSVDVDVALKVCLLSMLSPHSSCSCQGSGPWNLQLQVVGPRGSEIINIPSIKDSRKTISVPIPKNIAKHGGSFNVDIIGVEDSNGCKRSISVPSASVDVRRVKVGFF
jgi:nucleoporin POM152